MYIRCIGGLKKKHPKASRYTHIYTHIHIRTYMSKACEQARICKMQWNLNRGARVCGVIEVALYEMHPQKQTCFEPKSIFLITVHGDGRETPEA